mmetsp:Transcript_36608/g.32821  ORF Transcript_36608/g.32821 Transcript_36608/m.32821 type:complete len:94 (+) Transcript_36608:448-729(+)
MEDNEPFQDLANCSGECFVKSGTFPFTCYDNECKDEWNECKSDKDCKKAIACSNTCFGDEDCQKDCSDKISGDIAEKFFTCSLKCFSNHFNKH